LRRIPTPAPAARRIRQYRVYNRGWLTAKYQRGKTIPALKRRLPRKKRLRERRFLPWR
jgi:hypothetical protein